MDPVAFLTSTRGRLAPQPFALGVLGVWLAGLAAQWLLSGEIMARSGVWPFVAAQALLLWFWLTLHIKRLRDAGQGPAGAIGVALIYLLSIALLLMLVAFFTNPNAVETPGADRTAGEAASATLLVLFLIAIIVKPDFGVFMMILKALIVMMFLPGIISLVFSVVTGLRKRVP